MPPVSRPGEPGRILAGSGRGNHSTRPMGEVVIHGVKMLIQQPQLNLRMWLLGTGRPHSPQVPGVSRAHFHAFVSRQKSSTRKLWTCCSRCGRRGPHRKRLAAAALQAALQTAPQATFQTQARRATPLPRTSSQPSSSSSRVPTMAASRAAVRRAATTAAWRRSLQRPRRRALLRRSLPLVRRGRQSRSAAWRGFPLQRTSRTSSRCSSGGPCRRTSRTRYLS
mmetsp:Transcript_19365/g.58269  ORF Transcript_19365/g.58269 Transcript_19365/m.58269 type:complete len:223 (+) Transcript_19365:434-1102(+)